MDREEVMTLLDNQRKFFNDALDRMERNFTKTQENSDKKISEVIVSLEFTQAKLDEALVKLKDAEGEKKEYALRIQTLNQENQELRDKVGKYETRLDYLDDQSRRNNLRFAGIPEESGETWEQCQVKVAKIVKDRLNIPEVNLERAHRIGKINSQRPRDIIAKFSRFPERDAVFRARTELKGTNLYVNEDYCPGTMDARRQQMDALRDARRSGKLAFFNYRTLVVRDRLRSEAGGRSGQGREGQATAGPRSPRTPPTTPPRTPTVQPVIKTTTHSAPTTPNTTKTTPSTTGSLTWSTLARSTPPRTTGEVEGAVALPPRTMHTTSEARQLRDRTGPASYKGM